jgi:hypothetical protein
MRGRRLLSDFGKDAFGPFVNLAPGPKWHLRLPGPLAIAFPLLPECPYILATASIGPAPACIARSKRLCTVYSKSRMICAGALRIARVPTIHTPSPSKECAYHLYESVYESVYGRVYESVSERVYECVYECVYE